MNVVVERPWGAAATFSRCVADVFEKGILTISGQESGDEIETFSPGDWVTASMIEDDGQLFSRFESVTPRGRVGQLEKAS